MIVFDEVHRDYRCTECGLTLATDEYLSAEMGEDGAAQWRQMRYCPRCGAPAVIDKTHTAWQKWVDGLDHGDECETTMDVIEQMAFDLLEHGGDMGPNGNTWDGVDEGDVLTTRFFEGYRSRLVKSVERGHGWQTMGTEPMDETVLVHDHGNLYVGEFATERNGREWFSDGGLDHVCDAKDVDAWMPVPEFRGWE